MALGIGAFMDASGISSNWQHFPIYMEIHLWMKYQIAVITEV